MRVHLLTAVLAVVLGLFIGVGRAEAQRGRAPEKDMWAIGGSAGVSAPNDASLGSGFDLAGNVEDYLTSRVSLRAQVSGGWWDITGRHFTGTVNPFVIDGNIVYNWEGGKWHPYVTGGVGLYHFHAHEDPALDSGDSNFGGDFGGGVEFFYRRRSTITGEVLYHAVGAFNTPLATFNSGSFWTFTAGLKHYF